MNKPIKFRALAAATLITALLAACSTSEPALTPSNAWLRAVVPGTDRTAGYVTVENTFDSAVKLVGASSPNFGRVELHTMSRENGQMQMRPVDGFTIEAGETLALKPSGDHLMLLFPRGEFGAQVPFSLAFRGPDGGLMSLDVSFTVQQ
ncbi:copper chaperone PCu(A)C [bacterium]|nr:copper chaperone PCu(A)C [bacterium]